MFFLTKSSNILTFILRIKHIKNSTDIVGDIKQQYTKKLKMWIHTWSYGVNMFLIKLMEPPLCSLFPPKSVQMVLIDNMFKYDELDHRSYFL